MSRPGDRRREAVRLLLSQHAPSGEEERSAIAATLALLDRVADPFARSTVPGHLTASAVVLAPEADALLLVRHRKLDRWLQPGGHTDPLDASLLATAIRETREETGLDGLESPFGDRLLHVDVHDIPAWGDEPAHRHHDVRFLLTAPREATTARIVEVDRAAWFPLDALDALELDRSLRAAIALAQTAIAGR